MFRFSFRWIAWPGARPVDQGASHSIGKLHLAHEFYCQRNWEIGLGKNYLRAIQYRDLLSIRPDGARLCEFHRWEKKISLDISTNTCEDVPILDYLERLEAIGENPDDYQTIWYYF